MIPEKDEKILRLVGRVADSLGLECHAVGGYVRDCFLKRASKDIDFVTVGSGIELAQAVARELGAGSHIAVFRNFGTAQVKWHDTELEFVGARRESYSHDSRKPIVEDGTLDDDLSRRDFTVNALAMSVNHNDFGRITDKFGGLGDMERRILRTPLDPDVTFSDDPLRMMRAIRFATQLRFSINAATFASITKNAARIEIISRERVADELMKIMRAPKPSIGWRMLLECGLLHYILPELEQMEVVDHVRGRAHKNNFDHTLKVLDNVAEVSDNVWLRWSALLHDIGKPQTKRWDDKLGWTFHNHSFVGSKMVPRLFRSLRLPMGEPMKFVQKMVDLHMRPIILSEEIVTDSAVRRLLFDAGNDVESLMTLCEADITTGRPEKMRSCLDNFAIVRQKLIELEDKDRIRNFQPPITGDDIMTVFGIPPSQPIKILKETVKNAILDGVIPNERQAAFQFLLPVAESIGLKPIKPLPDICTSSPNE
ncbi:MAG: CCA tRNA nucleotidyltransferase [Muribaculaceae bacterium]|nr:CCA tRNA nucleotidyltransferase [Muribaculaceae bacterium]MDE6461693.1 CCA tRNA nucleotidyltransferase [Muribaculaceae bacterium]MDE6509222.1 CCA tRNA nucleotidyltransferase [Muribaculaceae bacterium]